MTAADARTANRQLIEAYAGELSNGDLEAASAYWSDVVVMTVPGHNPYAGVFTGPEQVGAAIVAMRQALDEPPEADVFELLCGEEHVAALVSETARRNGRDLTFRRVVVYGVAAGEISSITVFHEDEYAVDEFFS